MNKKTVVTLQLIDFIITKSHDIEVKQKSKDASRIAHKVAKGNWKQHMLSQDTSFTKHGYKPQTISL